MAEKADHEECMIVLRAAADKIEAQRVETLSILQEACAQGDLPAVKSILSALDSLSIQNLINFAPGGANTLLFKGNFECIKVLHIKQNYFIGAKGDPYA